MHRVLLFLSLLSTPSAIPYCPPTQRYDVAQFPPRCMDCPQVIPNQLSMSQIRATVQIRRAQKFSPGLPQNSTCGCWRAPANQTVDAALNTSWIVSGLIFNSNTRSRWLREIQINASADNVTFIDWGTYTAQNFSEASVAIFTYPIRAQYFRITVIRYANHYINDSSTGFPVSVSALAGQSQPFGCGCPLLSTGLCCPFQNMTVRNDTCIWCMDPTQISTVMVNGCGRCKPGTFEYQGRCVYKRMPNTNNMLQIKSPESDGMFWTAGLQISKDSKTVVAMFLTKNTSFVHPCMSQPNASCLATANSSCYFSISQEAAFDTPSVLKRLDVPIVSVQYIQFDRGRYTLNMTQNVIRSWTSCSSTICNGMLGVLFITLFDDGTFKIQTELLPLKFNFGIPNLVATVGADQTPTLSQMEIHSFSNNQWALRLIGIQMRGECIYLQWDTNPALRIDYQGDDFTTIPPPPQTWSTLRVTEGLNSTTLTIQQPIKVVEHRSQTLMQYNGIVVSIQYGFNFTTTPSPGDSEQIIFISAKSPQPIRLKNLAIMSQGFTVIYTTPKGFIIDPTRVLDLGMACSQPTSNLNQWVTQAMSILPDNPPAMLQEFIRASCYKLTSNVASKAYWMVSARATTSRTTSYSMGVVAEFA